MPLQVILRALIFPDDPAWQQAFRIYEERKKELHLLDFDDLLLRTRSALRAVR